MSIVAPNAAVTQPLPADFERVEDYVLGLGPEATAARDLLIYVHIPFCNSKCSFCAWVQPISARELRSGPDVRQRYVDAIIRQIAEYGPRLSALGYSPKYVYWGGGTPSILSPDQILAVGEALMSHFDLSEVRQYSVESSPETLSSGKLAAFGGIGVNRISIGIQSFDDRELRLAARAHSADDARNAVCMAKELGPGNLNIDLITGFPRQTEQMLAASMEVSVDLAPEHVTVYPYRAMPGTVMHRQMASGHLPSPSAAVQARLSRQARSALGAAHYEEYMLNYYALNGAKPFLAEKYYFDLEGDFFGFGSGAHSRLAHHWLQNRKGNLPRFMSAPAQLDRCERLTPASSFAYSSPISRIFNGGGRISYERFRDTFGFPFGELNQTAFLRRWRDALKAVGAELVMTSTEVYVHKPQARIRSRSEISRAH